MNLELMSHETKNNILDAYCNYANLADNCLLFYLSSEFWSFQFVVYFRFQDLE